MKAYVITIMDNIRSVQVADRCIKSGKKFNLDIQKFEAITPRSNPSKILAERGINPAGFTEIYSRTPNCMSAFLSHHTLWQKAIDENENILILEHDAVIKDYIPEVPFTGCISLGKPSYGKFNTPPVIGVNSLTSKKYFPGAHAYIVSPYGAKKLIAHAKENARPTDVFLNIDSFPFLQEYYPWPVEVNDSFSTIQNQIGCIAKHNYGETYEII